jgi:hypothetical protein
MCGQVHVASVRVESLPDVWAAFRRDGFTITPCDSVRSVYDEAVRLRRDDRESVLGIDNSERDPAEAVIVVSSPPYSVWPWRWVEDQRFFDDLTAVLDEFHYCA